MNKKILSLIIFLIFSITSNAQSLKMSTDANSEGNPKITITNTGSYDLIVDDATGDSESNALTTYAAVGIGVGTSTNNPQAHFTGTTASMLDATGTAGNISFAFKLTYAGVDKKIVIGTKDASETDYKVVSIGSDTISESFDTYTYTISFSTLCASIDCTNLTSTGIEQNHYIYAYLADTNVSLDNFDPTADGNDNGIFIRVYLSTKFDTATSINLDPIQPGDSSLYLTYESTDPAIANFYDVIVVNNGTGGSAFQASGTASVLQDFPATIASTVQVKGLDNGTTYTLGVMFRNKYLMGTNLSLTDAERPQLIPPFLAKSACYLVSAGFKEDHYVLDYLRDFRDSVLLEYTLGRKFVKFYYSTAPKYAMMVYENNLISLVLRMVGYISYFIIKYFYSIMSLILLAVAVVVVNRKRKVIESI